mgnify:CR=1 FL=1|jgi:hypothetical protein
MEQKYYWIFGILVILGVLVINGCVKQEVTPLSTEEEITNQCINELNVFENKFGISGENVKILSSSCSACSPWYTPQVATFDATIEKDGKRYDLFFSDNCSRHEQITLNYNILSEGNTEIYSQMKDKICTDFSYWKIYLDKCMTDVRKPPSINEFTSCINDYSYYIENNIIDIDKDWGYCSTEGWKRCKEWNSCGPTGPSQTSICTPEYCKMSCLIVYSREKIQEKFINICKDWDEVEDNKYVFSFEVPEDIEEIISTNFLK